MLVYSKLLSFFAVNIPFEFLLLDFSRLDSQQSKEGPGRPPVTPISEDSAPSRSESLPSVQIIEVV